MTAKWQSERDKLAGATGIKEELDRARAELDQAKRVGDLGRAGELSYGVIPCWKANAKNCFAWKKTSRNA